MLSEEELPTRLSWEEGWEKYLEAEDLLYYYKGGKPDWLAAFNLFYESCFVAEQMIPGESKAKFEPMSYTVLILFYGLVKPEQFAEHQKRCLGLEASPTWDSDSIREHAGMYKRWCRIGLRRGEPSAAMGLWQIRNDPKDNTYREKAKSLGFGPNSAFEYMDYITGA